MDSSRQHGVVELSEVFAVADEGVMALLCAPIFVDGVSDGFVIAVLSPEQFLAAAVDAQLAAGYDIALYRRSGEVVRLGDHRDLQSPWRASAELGASAMRSTLVAWPKPQTVSAERSGLPDIVLFTGLLMASSAAMVVYYGQAARRTTQALAAANVELTTASERSEGRLRAVVDTAADGIITASEVGIVESFNPAAERMFGYAAREVVGRNLNMLMPEPYHSAHDGYLKRYADTRVPSVVGGGREALGRRKDGSTFAMHLSVSEMILPEGRRFAGIVRDISDMKRIDAQRTQLLHRVMTMQEVERARIAEGLHEQVGQELTAVVLGLRAAESGDSLDKVRDVLAEVRRQATSTIEDVRLMAVEMQPGSLADLGLAAVLDTDVRAIAAREGFDATVNVHDADALTMSHEAQLSLYRIVHGALSNVVSHAAASHVNVTVGPQDGRIAAMVEDDGAGFDTNPIDGIASHGGVGLLAMHERARMLGGSVTVESSPGEGTVVFIDVPNGPPV